MLSIQNLAIVPFAAPCSRETLSNETFSDAYTEITRRIPEEELSEIEKNIKKLSPCDQQRFLELAQLGDLSAIIHIQDYPLHALYAVKTQKITQEEFATISLAYASPDLNKTCIPLFNPNGTVNPEARELIKQTLSLNNPIQSFGSLLTSDELDSFFVEMAKLSPLQQHFFLEQPRPSTESGEIEHFGMKFTSELPTVRTAIETQYAGLNIFSKCSQKEEPKFMIPSAGMMQTFLNVKFKENSVRMNFVLGLSSVEDITNNGLTASRDAALPFPGTSLPTTADKLPAKWTDFTYHDFFHAIVVSCATPSTRKQMISLAHSIQNIANPALYNFFIDLEMSGHYTVNVILKEDTSEYSKLLMDLDTRIAVGIIVDPDLQNSFYRDRILYTLAKELEPNIENLQEYMRWGESASKKQLEKHSNKLLQLETGISEIEEELLEVSSIKIEELQTQHEAFKTLLSANNFTEATTTEEDISKKTILNAVKQELQTRYDTLSMGILQARIQMAMRDQAPVAKIIHILERTCFAKPDPEICCPNASLSQFDSPRRITPLPSGHSTLTPMHVLGALITLILLRVLFRRPTK